MRVWQILQRQIKNGKSVFKETETGRTGRGLLLLLGSLALAFCAPWPCAAIFLSSQTVRAAAPEEDAGLDLYAGSAVLMDGESGRVLYGKEENTPLPMASTTKIMTCILALEQLDEDTICTASENAAAQPQVKLGMNTGDTFYLGDLLYSLMLESHNDTAVCIAETAAGSTEGFAAMMNEKAREIGCTQTYYITPNGLDAEDDAGAHHTTARELALVMRYCLTQSPMAEEFIKITGTPAYSFTDISGSRSYDCVNHNAFLNQMEGALSGKTGFTSKAGYCYVGALKREDTLLIVSLLACGWPNHKTYKWSDTKMLMNYGLSNFERKNITNVPVPLADLAVTKGQETRVKTRLRSQNPVWVLMAGGDEVEIRAESLQSLRAPVEEGEQTGLVHYLVGGEEYASVPVEAAAAVKKQTFLFCLGVLAEDFLL